MVDSVNTLIFADRRITIADISEQLRISVGKAYKILYDDLAVNEQINVQCVSYILTKGIYNNHGNT